MRLLRGMRAGYPCSRWAVSSVAVGAQHEAAMLLLRDSTIIFEKETIADRPVTQLAAFIFDLNTLHQRIVQQALPVHSDLLRAVAQRNTLGDQILHTPKTDTRHIGTFS